MISIIPDRLYMGYHESRTILGMLTAHKAAVEEVQNSLAVTSGMESICHLLKSINTNIDEHIEQWRNLCQGIDTICQIYTSCENRILDACEDAMIHYSQPSIFIVDLAATAEILEEFSFTADGGDQEWQQDILK